MTTQAELIAKYESNVVAVNPFAQSRMGLKPGLTAVRIETYNIICVPYRLSMKGAVLIASFSKDELAFFQRFVNGLAGLTLVFQPGNSQTPLKIFARCLLKSVSPMKGRESVGLIEIQFKPCPPDLSSILVDYFLMLDRLREEYETYKDNPVAVNPTSARIMGYNNYAQIDYQGTSAKVAVFSFSSATVEFLVPMNGPVLEQEKPVQMKLFFQSYQFAAAGVLTTVVRLQNGVQKVKVTLQFSPELVSIIEQYRFNEQLQHRVNQNEAAKKAESPKQEATTGSQSKPA